MDKGKIARATVTIGVSRDRVWKALTSPAEIKRYFFGTDAVSDWKPGASITWTGNWDGKHYYEDKGTVLESNPGRLLRYTHYSPLSGQPDTPESYHTVTIALSDAAEPLAPPQRSSTSTRLVLTQDNNTTDEAREHSEKNWAMVLTSLKNYLEGGTPG
jgi:uncharacterized protein YndB with AHSA1/START domain